MKSAPFLLPAAGLCIAGLAAAATAFLAPDSGNVDRGFQTNVLYATSDFMLSTTDPGRAAMKGEIDVLGQVFEGLVRLDPVTLEPVPAAAESWEVSPDGLTYVFRLRPGLRWSDGTPLSSASFRATARRVLSPEARLLRARVFLALKGAREFRSGKTDAFETVGVRTPDDRTLLFELESPAPRFLQDLAGAGGWPTPPSLEFRREPPGFENLVSNGPFRLVSVTPERMELERNPHYWAPGIPRLNGVVYVRASDESALEPLRYDAGMVHISSGMAGATVDRLQGRGDLRVQEVMAVYYLRFDTTQAPFNDPRLRLALSLAIDRDTLAAERRDPAGFAAWGFVPPLVPGYAAPTVLKERRSEARALLDAALKDLGVPLPPLTIHFGPGDEPRQAALAVARDWQQALGLAADVRPIRTAMVEGQQRPPLEIVGLAASQLDPLNLVGNFGSGHDLAGTGWKNRPFVEGVSAAMDLSVTPERLKRATVLEQTLLLEAPVAPLFFGRQAQLIHPRVKGWVSNPLDLRCLREVSFE